jgi:hypothetical protein
MEFVCKSVHVVVIIIIITTPIYNPLLLLDVKVSAVITYIGELISVPVNLTSFLALPCVMVLIMMVATFFLLFSGSR